MHSGCGRALDFDSPFASRSRVSFAYPREVPLLRVAQSWLLLSSLKWCSAGCAGVSEASRHFLGVAGDAADGEARVSPVFLLVQTHVRRTEHSRALCHPSILAAPGCTGSAGQRGGSLLVIKQCQMNFSHCLPQCAHLVVCWCRIVCCTLRTGFLPLPP